jgi:CPA2 family monovalent cation:H+ antiporter-2/glutathione-regulated potassium-efflux system ancillary protein KefC
MTEMLSNAFIYLVAAVVAVPVAKRLGLSSVLGYLIAGVMIGPVLGLVGEEMQTLQHYAEFGVVMMLFLVGLELEPRMLWNMRSRLFGLGGLQVASTAAAVTVVAMLFGLPWQSAVAVGLMFSLSSTAIVLQTFDEKGLASTPGGRAAFSVLLFQDIAVIPMLALVPLLALPALVAAGIDAGHAGGTGHDAFSWVADLEAWEQAFVVLGSIVGVVLGGHFLSRPLFRVVAATGLREAFTAVALMLVIGVALLMMAIGLSPALGTFLAGVVLANSEFRHELETNILPFKGLLLGLFFITVGAGIQFELLGDRPSLVLGLTLGIMLLKLVLLFGLAVVFGVRRSDGWLFALSLAQAGEFGFVLLNYSVIQGVIDPAYAPILSLVVALSMFLTPLLFMFFDRAVMPRYVAGGETRESDAIDEQAPVIIAGIGRFGQIVNRLLTANGVKTVVLDRQVGQVDNMRRIRMKSYFGDATRSDLLEAAGLAQASLFVVAIDDTEDAVSLVHELKRRHPRLGVLARGFDRGHMYRLREAGADYVVMETYHSALELGTRALRAMGIHPFKAEQLKGAFTDAEERGRDQLYRAWLKRPEGERMGDDYLQLFMELDAVLRDVMQRDRDDGHTRSERGWTPPPKALGRPPDAG